MISRGEYCTVYLSEEDDGVMLGIARRKQLKVGLTRITPQQLRDLKNEIELLEKRGKL